jgi:anion-transporting  ArsA/GET3 family ATPase
VLICFETVIDTAPMIETVALAAVPELGDAVLGTLEPTEQVLAVERSVRVWGGLQGPMEPTFQVRVVPEMV